MGGKFDVLVGRIAIHNYGAQDVGRVRYLVAISGVVTIILGVPPGSIAATE